ncbi:MAG: arginine--tRNA ligase [Clostridia bacterium]|nr:arginine--tRNA ligase [Clostridia bacterium]
MNIVEKVQSEIRNILSAALGEAYSSAQTPDFLVEVPKDPSNGDYSTNMAMLLARQLKLPPREIASKIVACIPPCSLISKIDIAGAGFINFYLNNSYLYEVISEIENKCEDYGKINIGNGKKINVEFVSANPTGPMHMGNARGGAIGDCLASVLQMAGYDVTREFYVNDAGAQIDKFGRSLEARYRQILTGSTDFPEDGYKGDDITVHAQNYIDLYGDKLLNVSEAERKQALIDYALPLNLKKMKKDLKNYRIEYDNWFYESSLHNNGDVLKTIELLKETSLVYEKDGALWFKSTEFIEKRGEDDRSYKDDVLVRDNGIPTYFAADIAYHRNKLLTRDFDLAINIWGADHHGHIARMKGALQALGLDPDKLYVITMQLVRLMENGEIVRMSKRTGKMITLSDLLEDIGVDAARFFFNLRQAGSHFDFDLSLAVSQTNDNPVFYVQYAHARICSILRLMANDGINVLPYSEIDASLLTAPQEVDLLKKIAELPEEVRIAAELYEPSRLTRYVTEVSALFHSFYNACRIRGEEPALAAARLKLCDCVRIVIANCLKALGVTAPQKM